MIYWRFGGKAQLYQALMAGRFGPANAILGEILSGDQLRLARQVEKGLLCCDEGRTTRGTAIRPSSFILRPDDIGFVASR